MIQANIEKVASSFYYLCGKKQIYYIESDINYYTIILIT